MPDSLLNAPLYRNRIRTTIFGARLALDDDGMLIGPPAFKEGVTTQGSTATNMPAHGVTFVGAAAASTYILDAPMTGITKRIFQVGSGSSHNIITGTSNIKITSTLGSSQQRICLQTTGDFADLVAISTAQWAYLGGSAGVCLTT
jgi:hypothetical protein